MMVKMWRNQEIQVVVDAMEKGIGLKVREL
jgi:hypothetical protein